MQHNKILKLITTELLLYINIDINTMILWGEQNLGPYSGLKYHILPTIRPRRGNYKGTS